MNAAKVIGLIHALAWTVSAGVTSSLKAESAPTPLKEIKNDQRELIDTPPVQALGANENQNSVELHYYESPTAPPTQAVEWVASYPTSTYSYEDLSMSGTGQYVLSSNVQYGIQWSKDYGVSFSDSYNTAGSAMAPYTGASWFRLQISSDGSKGVAIAAYNGIAFSNDNGRYWSISNVLSPTIQWTVLAASSDLQHIYVLPNMGQFAYSSDGGTSFTTSTSGSFPTTLLWTAATCSGNGQYVAAAANAELIYVSSDFGATWAPMSNPIYNGWIDLASSASGQYMYALSTQNTLGVYVSSDYGVSWTLTSGESSLTYSSIATDASGATVFVVAPADGIFTSTDFGSTWSAVTAPLNSYELIATSNDSQKVIASTETNGLYYYIGPPQPTDWVKTYSSTASWGGIASSQSGMNVVAWGLSYTFIYYSTDMGVTFTQSTNSPTENMINVVMDANGVNMFALSETYLYRSSDRGASWTTSTALPSADYPYYSALGASSDLQYIFAARSYDDQIYVSTDGGVSFNQVLATASSMTWKGFGVSASGQYVAAIVSYGYIFYSNDYGATWTQSDSEYANFLSIAASSSGQYMVAVTANTNPRGIWTSSNYGANWVLTTASTDIDYFSVASDSTGQYLAVVQASSSPVLMSDDYGATWYNGDAPPNNAFNWRAIASDSTGGYLVAAVYNVGLYTEDVPGITPVPTVFSSPTPSPTKPTIAPSFAPSGPPDYYHIASSPTSSMDFRAIVTSQSGQYVTALTGFYGMYCSTDYGRSYAPSDGTSGYSWVSLVMDSTAQTQIALCDNKGIFKSTNFGASFTSDSDFNYYSGQSNGLPTTQYAGMAADSNLVNIYIVTNGNAFYKSTDGGDTFSQVSIASTSPQLGSVATSSSGQYVTVGTWNSYLYVSSDYGATFTPVTSTGMATWVSIAASSTGQYWVATYLEYLTGVYVSHDYGVTWFGYNSTEFAFYQFRSVDVDSTGQYMFAIAQGVPMFQSNDYGTTWTLSPTGTENAASWVSVSCDSTAENINVAVYYEGMYFYDPNYTSPSPTIYSTPTVSPTVESFWKPATTDTTESIYLDGTVVSESGQYSAAYGPNYGIYISSNYGYSFVKSSAMTSNSWKGLVIGGSNPAMMIALDQNQGLYFSMNYGANWMQSYNLPVIYGSYYTAIAADSSLTYVFVTQSYDGNLLLSTDGAQSFTAANIQSNGQPVYGFAAVVCSQNGQYVVVTTQQTYQMFVSSDYGVTWSEVTYPGEMIGFGVSAMAISENGQYVIGISANNYDNIFLSSDYGLSWTTANAEALQYTSVTMDASGQRMYATLSGSIEQGAPVIQSTDYGATWSTANAPCDGGYCNFRGIASDASGGLVLALSTTYATTIYYSQDPSITSSPTVFSSPTPKPTAPTHVPTQIPSPQPTSYSSPTEQPTGVPTEPVDWYPSELNPSGQYVVQPAMSASGEYAIVTASCSAFFVSSDYGLTLNQTSANLTEGDCYKTAALSSDGQAMMVLGNANLLVSTDFGATFTKTWNLSAASLSSGTASIAGSSNLSTVYVAPYEAYGLSVYKSTDGGWTFVAMPSFENNSFSSVYIGDIACSADGQRVVVVGSGNVYYSSDGGTTWLMSSTPYGFATYNSVAMSANGEYVYTTVYGIVLASSDYGATFSLTDAQESFTSVATDSTGQYVAAATAYSAIALSSDYGTSFYRANSPYYVYGWNGVAMDGTGELMMATAGYYGVYFKNPSVAAPSAAPTVYTPPTSHPSVQPSSTPTARPQTTKPTTMFPLVTSAPSTHIPTVTPPELATATPSVPPSVKPSVAPAATPSVQPSSTPTARPQTTKPSIRPSISPTTRTPSAPTKPTASPMSMEVSQEPTYLPTFSAVPSPAPSTESPTLSLSPVTTSTPTVFTTSLPTVDTSLNWQASKSPDATWYGISVNSNGQNMSAIVFGGGVFYSWNFGLDWHRSDMADGRWLCIAGSSNGQYLTVGSQTAGLYLSSNYGANWTHSTAATGTPWLSLCSSDDGQIRYAGTYANHIATSSDFGVTWALLSSSPMLIWQTIACDSSGQRVLAGALGGAIYYSSNGGATWVAANAPNNFAWNKIVTSGDGQYCVAIAIYAGMYTSTDYGVNWIAVSNVTGAYQAQDVDSSSSGQTLVATVIGGYIYVSVDYGASWLVSNDLVAPWGSVAVSGSGEVVAVALLGGPIVIGSNASFWFSPTVYPTNSVQKQSNAGAVTEIFFSDPISFKLIIIIVPAIVVFCVRLGILLFRYQHRQLQFVAPLNEVSDTKYEIFDSLLKGMNLLLAFNALMSAKLAVALSFLVLSRGLVFVAWLGFMVMFFAPMRRKTNFKYQNLFLFLDKSSIQSVFTVGICRWKVNIPAKHICLSVLIISMFDMTMLRLLPWTRSEFTAKVLGYPNMFVVRCCLYSTFISSVCQATAGMLNILLSKNQATLVFVVMSLFNLILSFLSVILFVQMAKADTIHMSVTFGTHNDHNNNNNNNNRQECDLELQNRNTVVDTLDTTEISNPIFLTSIAEQPEIEATVVPNGDEKATAAVKKSYNTREDGTIEETETDERGIVFNTTVPYADQTVVILKEQLMKKGENPLEYIPLPTIKLELADLFAAANNGIPYDEGRLDYLLTCMDYNPEYKREMEEEARLWRADISEYVTDCLETMKNFVPPYIFNATLKSLIDVEGGYSISLAKRLLAKKCLWLVRVNQPDIERMHIAELQGRFNPQAQGLDIVETAAVYAALPDVFAKDHKKEIWRQTIEAQLKKMHAEMKKGTLAKAKLRHPAYNNQHPQFNQRDSMHDMRTVSGADAFKPRDSFRRITSADLRADLDKVRESLQLQQQTVQVNRPFVHKIDMQSIPRTSIANDLSTMLTKEMLKRGSIKQESSSINSSSSGGNT